MRRPSSLPIVMQVAALTAAAVVATLGVAFAVILLAPPPPPPGMTVKAAADALRGLPAQSADGRPLKRRIVADVPELPKPRRFAGLVTGLLAKDLDVAEDQIRVVIPETAYEARTTRMQTVIRKKPPQAQATDEPPVIHAMGLARSLTPEGPFQITLLSEGLSFAPEFVAMRLPDGRWATVQPPHGLLSPWQARVLLALGASLLLLAPLVWWMARRLTRPIRLFAEAAERLGADPEADPMPPSGPAEVRTAIEAFNDMQASLKGHMRQRTQTVAAIAHDLRTPLTRLRFRAEQAPAKVRDRMAADIEEMDALIAQAMAYVRGETPSHRRERFDLAALTADVARGFAETGAAVTAALPEPLWVEADPAALRRALTNLIGNAVKYAEAAEISGRIDGDETVIEVADRGPGVADEALELLFEPFRRGEASRNRDTGGAGLGLTVARQAARASGGDVTLSNRSGGGLTATLRLPSSD